MKSEFDKTLEDEKNKSIIESEKILNQARIDAKAEFNKEYERLKSEFDKTLEDEKNKSIIESEKILNQARIDAKAEFNKEYERLKSELDKTLEDEKNKSIIESEKILNQTRIDAKIEFNKEYERLKSELDKTLEDEKNKSIIESEKILNQTRIDAKVEFNKEYERQHLLLIFRNLLLKELHNKLKNIEIQINKLEKNVSHRERILESIDKDMVEKNRIIEKLEETRSNLIKEINQYELDIYSAEYGVYNFRYNFISSKIYEDKIKEVREKQKKMIKEKDASICSTDWVVGNSKHEGQKMISRNFKMMLRAFNGECDSIISNVTYKNINSMVNKIIKSFENINKLNEVLKTKISYYYFQLKLEELYLVHEFNEKKYEEKEEARIIKRQIREEQKAQKEFDQSLIKAEKEVQIYSKVLDKTRKELKGASENKIKKLNSKIEELEKKLEEVERNKRAISQAQITKSGYIYIISNIGSFGENVYKIGMTRRLEPLDRIRELNGPSVPFVFDIHAMIFSKNAPELELKLHKELSIYKMNRVNKRKEFFKVNLKDIENEVKKNGESSIEFSYEHEAKEYRLSEKMRVEDEKKN